MIPRITEPYSDDYLQSWIITAFLRHHEDNGSPDLKEIQAGLRYFLNEQRKLGKTGILNDLPQGFLTFIESNEPTLSEYKVAVSEWVSFAKQRFCPKAKYLGNLYTYFELPFDTFSHPVKQRIYGALAIWTAGFIGTAIAADKHAADSSILIAITLGSMALLIAYWHHIGKDRVTGPVEAMKTAPHETTCEFKQANAATNHSRSWWSSPVDNADSRRALERHVGGTPSLLNTQKNGRSNF